MEEQSKNVKTAFDQFADLYQEKYMSVEAYAESLDVFLQLLPRENSRVLDVGCGPGNISLYLLNKNSRLELTGIDISPRMIQLAAKNNPAADFLIMDVKEMGKLTPGFDGIIVGFCLPYLSRESVGQLIKDSRRLLSDKGVIYLSSMEGKYEDSGLHKSSAGEGPALISYRYESAELRKLLEEYGFEVLFQKAQPFEDEHHPATDLMMIAQVKA